MIKVVFVEPNNRAWNRWKSDGENQKNSLIGDAAAGSPLIINERLYKRMKTVFMETFNGKCAYCESRITTTHPGDIDHFRPKAAVTDENDNPVQIVRGGTTTNHPGYFWLAYNWRNLLPSCNTCNRPENRGGVRIGKRTRFPVDGLYATQPDEEVRENYLLLHPIFDEPSEHFIFDKHTGILSYKTNRGDLCIKILGLNREGLPEERKRVYDMVWASITETFSASKHNSMIDINIALRRLSGYKEGREAYSFAGRQAIIDARPTLEELCRILL